MLHTPWRQAAGFTSQIPRSLGKSWKSYVNPKLLKQELNFRGVSPAAVPTGMLLEVLGSPWPFWRCSWRARGPPGPSGDANPAVPQQPLCRSGAAPRGAGRRGPCSSGSAPQITQRQRLLAPLLPEITPSITLRRAGLSHDGSIHLLGSAPRSPAPSSSLQRETEALGMDT